MEFFLLDAVKMENLTQRWTQSVPFFPKIKAFFFYFQKRQGENVSVDESASISLISVNIATGLKPTTT